MNKKEKDKTKKEDLGPGGDRTLDLQFSRQICTRLVFLFQNKKEKAIQQLWMHNNPRNSVKDKTKKDELGPGGDRTLDLQFTGLICTRLVFLSFEQKRKGQNKKKKN